MAATAAAGLVLKGRFFNRSRELKMLGRALTPGTVDQPGRILMLLGPKDSGKTALIRRFQVLQEEGDASGVSTYVDLRQRSNLNPEDFSHNIWQSLGRSLELKCNGWEARCTTDNAFVLKVPGEASFSYTKTAYPDGLSRVMAAFEQFGLSWKNVYRRGYRGDFPTIFIDEANAFSAWTTTPGGNAALDSLLRFLVRITKQEGGANLVMSSADNFFLRWLLRRGPLSGHKYRVGTVGHLTSEEAKAFLAEMVDSESRMREVDAMWGDVHAHLGGSVVLLHLFADELNNAAEQTVTLVWQELKDELCGRAWENVQRGLNPVPFEQAGVRSSPAWTTQQWLDVCKMIVESPSGAIPYRRLPDAAAADSMIEHDLVQYRVYSSWASDVIADKADYPVVLANTVAENLAMSSLLVDYSPYFEL